MDKVARQVQSPLSLPQMVVVEVAREAKTAVVAATAMLAGSEARAVEAEAAQQAWELMAPQAERRKVEAELPTRSAELQQPTAAEAEGVRPVGEAPANQAQPARVMAVVGDPPLEINTVATAEAELSSSATAREHPPSPRNHPRLRWSIRR